VWGYNVPTPFAARGVQGGTMTGFTLEYLNGNFYFLHRLRLME